MINTLNQLLLLDGEDEIVEFKQANQSFDFEKLGKYFSALSNEANLKKASRAWLVFGVKDDLSVVGSLFRTQVRGLQSLKKEIADKTTSRVTFVDIHEVAHPDGRVLMLEIPAAPPGLPIAWNGHFYGRDGESVFVNVVVTFSPKRHSLFQFPALHPLVY